MLKHFPVISDAPFSTAQRGTLLGMVGGVIKAAEGCCQGCKACGSSLGHPNSLFGWSRSCSPLKILQGKNTAQLTMDLAPGWLLVSSV